MVTTGQCEFKSLPDNITFDSGTSVATIPFEFGSRGRYRWKWIWESWLLPFQLDLKLWQLQRHLRLRAVATTVLFGVDAVAAGTPFGFNALVTTD